MFAHDLCLSFFGECYARQMFALPEGATVLEIGCAEVDWAGPMKQARPDLHITSVDQRKPNTCGADVIVQGNVLQRDLFPPAAFDCAVSVSTIEHLGLGAYGDPLDVDGDTITMAHLRCWLRPDGWAYFDVPYGPYAAHKKYRRYDDASLQTRLLTGWRECARHVFTVDHPDSPYVALVVQPV